jgi:hypothetical protein
MFFIGVGLIILGLLLAILSGIWGLIQAFGEGTIWGVTYLFIPFAFVIFYMANWSQRRIRKNFILIIVGLILALVGSAIFGSHITNNFVADTASIPDSSKVVNNSENTSINTATTPVISDPFRGGINAATTAAELAQTANTQAEWNQVAINWHQALVLMKEVPPFHPQYEAAQNRIDLYRNNREIAKKKADLNN